MRKLSRRNKTITFTAIIVFLSIVAIVALNFVASSLVNMVVLERRDAVVAPLEMKRALLRRELSTLENDLTAALPNGATVTTVVTDLNTKLYDDVFPMYEGVAEDQDPGTLKLVGTMCLSEDELPGDEGNITLSQYNEMIESGWSTVLYVSKKNAKELTSYVTRMENKLEALSIPMPTGLYFELNAYAFELDGEILSLGMKYVMHHREHGLPLFGTDTDPELWRVGCISWNSGDTVNTFGNLVSTAGNLVITYSFERKVEEDYFPPDIYGANYSFNKMLNKFRSAVIDGDLEVENATVGCENYTEYKRVYRDMLTIMDARRLMLEEQIAKLDEQIFDIYNNFGELN